jgi:RNase adapter protein RapZ
MYAPSVADVQIVVVTGLSGAGRTTALRVLEDLGFYCVDNLPPSLAPQLLELLEGGDARVPVGLGIDVRTGAFLEGAEAALDELSARGYPAEVLFLDASDDAVVRRFSETRRPHLLAKEGGIGEAIRMERDRLSVLRRRASRVIDTTHLTVHDLRRQLVQMVSGRPDGIRMVTRIVSFGFKYGLPQDADLVFDLRFLPNPYFVSELRAFSGLDPKVASYVFGASEARDLLDELSHMLDKLLPRYAAEGKAYLTIALGCTGGRHRSVAMTEALAKRLEHGTGTVSVAHRDIERSGK